MRATILLLAFAAAVARGQSSAGPVQRRAVVAPAPVLRLDFGARATVRPNPLRSVRPELAPLLSALVPGAGQAVLGQDRAVVYAAVEMFLLIRRASDGRAQARQEQEYRGLARQVARAHFSATPPDGDWDYYETMEKWFESGAYSLSPTELVPESDVTTFNGSRWLLVQRNHGIDIDAPDRSSDAYRAALADYASQAAPSEFLWSWRNAQLEWDLYRRTINKRNDAAHAVGLDVTLLLANHVLSTVDAFSSFRLRMTPMRRGGTAVSATIPVGR
jgi:hypothetical protein